MVVYAMATKQEWEVESLVEFLVVFKLEKEALKHYEVGGLGDIYESMNYSSDDEEIMYWLDNHYTKRYFFCNYNFEDDGTWTIWEVTKEGIIK
jgi:hypothetical protein